MTCSRVFYGLIAALFAYVVVTVAAFRYLEWWQAILASAVTLGVIVFGAKLLVKAAVGRLGRMAQGLMEQNSKVLKNAGVDVHSVRTVSPPTDLQDDADLRTLRWYEIELSVFPDREHAGPADGWHPETLVLVRSTAKPPKPFGMGDDDSDTFQLRNLRVMVDGEPMDTVDEVTGPQRLRFTAGVPSGVRELTLRYVMHQFGRIRLPDAILPSARP